MALRLSEGLGVAEAEPDTYSMFHCLELYVGKCPYAPDQASVRDGYQTLRVKGPRFEKPCRNHDLKLRTSHACCVRDKSDKRTVRVSSRNAQDHAGSDLCSEAKINKPNLTAGR